jgi:hypothetical protein
MDAKQLKHNQKLWKYYPLGMVVAIFDILEGMTCYVDPVEHKALREVFKALEAFDQVVRVRRHKR